MNPCDLGIFQRKRLFKDYDQILIRNLKNWLWVMMRYQSIFENIKETQQYQHIKFEISLFDNVIKDFTYGYFVHERSALHTTQDHA